MTAAVSQRIANLLGGVSQQPDSLKLPGQVRAAKNCLPDPTYGMRKRPGLKLVSALANATNEGRWFSIFRDNQERYIGQFEADGDLKIWDAGTGQQKTVNAISAAAKAYIANATQDEFEMLQINDYNFVLNRSKTVGKLATVSTPQAPLAIVTVNLLGYDASYKVTLDGTTITHTTPETGTLDIQTVVADLQTQLVAIPGITAAVAGNTLVVQKAGGGDFTITGDGGTNAQALLVYKDAIPNVSRLPTSCVNGTILKVSNLDEAEGDDYYVEFKVTTGGASVGAGVWEECLKPGADLYIDPDTMPHVIIREANGTFTFRSLNEAQKANEDLYWVERRVGDDESNPFPSLVGSRITGISFFRNRLVLLSGSNVICSQPGSYFNLFRVSALAQTDADAVDLATGSLRPVDLRHALGDQQGLLIFSAKNQFMLTSDQDQFGPVSAKVVQFSSFDINAKVAPVETGVSYIYVDNNQGYSQVTEMVATSVENRPSVADLSRTAPNYIPANIQSIVASTSAGTVTFLAPSDADNLRVFKFFNNGNERVLASWMEWQLPGACLHQDSDSDILYLVTNQENGICLSTVSLLADVEGTAVNESGISYEYRLDLFTSSPTLAHDAGNDETKVYFKPGTYDSNLTPMVVVDDTLTERGSVYTNLVKATDGGGDYVTIPGNRTTALNVVLGYTYEFRLDLPSFYRKEQTGEGRFQSDVINIPRVTRMVIQGNDVGPYSAHVAVLGRPDKVYDFSQSVSNIYLANSSPLPSLIDNVIPIYGKGTDSFVSLYSYTPFPLSLVAATWYGIYSNRGIKAV
ncbi:tail protein [Synechococcus phage S-CBP2]|uniref:Tail tubular protein B n=1 Tax=Synechococcus phage S-CBP2 TaxID=756277 RepID=A0A096VL34_9CAUD|nr:tail protein [Synechococcus phage S-CBP2]AGF91081.1 tail tubular protein B [Synechococcus phage MRHenn-2013a]AGK86742.1 tail tubular protein B [Synechococcus phage S-CBP2]